MEAVLQAMTTISGSVSPIRSRHHRLDPGDERRFTESAIGKGRVVGGVNDFHVRPEAPDLGQHRKAAEPGIEHERPWGGAARPRPASSSAIRLRGRVAAPTPAEFMGEGIRESGARGKVTNIGH